RPAVHNPLGDVALHVIQPEGIGSVTSHGGSEDMAIAAGQYMSSVGVARGRALPLCRRKSLDEREIDPICILAAALLVITPEELGGRAGALGIFTLRFGQQPIGMPGLSAQPSRIGLGLIPAYAHHRVAASLWKRRRMPVHAHLLGPVRRLMDITSVRIPLPGLECEPCILVARHLELAHGK